MVHLYQPGLWEAAWHRDVQQIPDPELQRKRRGKKKRMDGTKRELLCKQCQFKLFEDEKSMKEREKRLRNQAKNSKRKGCTCGRLLGHEEKCPMHKRSMDERPYPWCDVMSHAESEWLSNRMKARKKK